MIQLHVRNMHRAGLSSESIAGLLGTCVYTVGQWLEEARQAEIKREEKFKSRVIWLLELRDGKILDDSESSGYNTVNPDEEEIMSYEERAKIEEMLWESEWLCYSSHEGVEGGTQIVSYDPPDAPDGGAMRVILFAPTPPENLISWLEEKGEIKHVQRGSK